MTTLTDLTRAFARIGILSFGGPAAQIAMMHRDMVDDRKWVSEQDFLSALWPTAADPTPLAVGIDEDTAVVIEPGKSLEVLGMGAVMVVDASEAIRAGSTSVTGAGSASGETPMLGLRVDLLTAGCRYDLRERRGRAGAAHGASDWMVPPSDKPQGE